MMSSVLPDAGWSLRLLRQPNSRSRVFQLTMTAVTRAGRLVVVLSPVNGELLGSKSDRHRVQVPAVSIDHVDVGLFAAAIRDHRDATSIGGPDGAERRYVGIVDQRHGLARLDIQLQQVPI